MEEGWKKIIQNFGMNIWLRCAKQIRHRGSPALLELRMNYRNLLNEFQAHRECFRVFERHALCATCSHSTCCAFSAGTRRQVGLKSAVCLVHRVLKWQPKKCGLLLCHILSAFRHADGNHVLRFWFGELIWRAFLSSAS